MPELKTLNIATEVLGMPVLDPDTARLHGRVTEVIVHPTMSTLVGLLMETPGGEERAALSKRCYISSNVGAVLTLKCFVSNPAELAGDLAEGVGVRRELLGAQVVTEAGEQLGHVTEVHLYEEYYQVIYRIARSGLQEFRGGRFFNPGRLPLRWLPEDAQLIVPAEPKLTANCNDTQSDGSDLNHSRVPMLTQ